MDDDHLRNSISMLRRNGCVTLLELTRMFCGLSMCQGEHAQDAAEADCMNAKPSSALRELLGELTLRGLKETA